MNKLTQHVTPVIHAVLTNCLLKSYSKLQM